MIMSDKYIRVLPQPRLVRVCAWCQPNRIILPDGNPGEVWQDRIDDPPTRPTHGICSRCILEQIEKFINK